MDCPVCRETGELEAPTFGSEHGFGTGFGAGCASDRGGQADQTNSGQMFLTCYRCGGSGFLEDTD